MSCTPSPDSARAGRHEVIRRDSRAHFDKWALSYDRSWLNELAFFPTLRICEEELTRWQMLRGRRPFRLLDIGCGTGTLVTRLAQQTEAEFLVGLDYSPVMVRHATEKIAGSPQAAKLQVLLGDAERLPFADE